MDQSCLIRPGKCIDEVFQKANIACWEKQLNGYHTLRYMRCGFIVKHGRRKTHIPCVIISSNAPLTPKLVGEEIPEELQEVYQYYDQLYQKYRDMFYQHDSGSYLFVKEDLGEYITLKDGPSSELFWFVRGMHKIFNCFTYFSCRWKIKGTLTQFAKEEL